ncbi:hypothetical protein C8J56DRAFT_895201 [Mycena floridula]|nr:hypothetical protein C8J56DRAFT_895201 [Mycena floridula]
MSKILDTIIKEPKGDMFGPDVPSYSRHYCFAFDADRFLHHLHIFIQKIPELSAIGEIAAASAFDSDFIIEVHEAQVRFSNCYLRYYRLSTIAWHSYPVVVAHLRWSIRAAKKDGRALLNKIKAHAEKENKRGHLGDIAFRRAQGDKNNLPDIH